MTLDGADLVKILSGSDMPQDIKKIINEALAKTKLPEYLFKEKIPLEIDYKELENEIKKRNANKFTNLAEEIKMHAEELKQVPELLKQLSGLLILEDFCLGINPTLSKNKNYPLSSENLTIDNVENLFIENSQPVSFNLDNSNRCSILTGANSGGKTTLLENILQKISLFQLGLPVSGLVHMPFFTDVYYFAKNNGAANKGAFENLLTQMSKIKPGESTLILADEIEAVTEPGVAGKVIAATADYFIKQNCFLVIATHLGYEIQESLPEFTRIDGIEAKGLDKNFNLIVDHNPILGRLAHSTPELIVEKMANTLDHDYFKYLNNFLKK
jgi:dsDNA-specific endonuclease/ATPase MutS2